tara:strand:- start:389 stop:1174 length:786 start_codon:yes stop_codon:yes gene_type:complete
MPQDRTSFVEGLYKNILKRDPDAEGLDYWSNSGLGDEAMTRAFNSSVEGLYQNVLGRAPDQAGFDNWTNSGFGPNDMTTLFQRSQEAMKPRVEDMYRNILGRTPDDVGVEGWSSQGLPETELLKYFHSSAEAAPRRLAQRDQESVVKPSYLHEGNNFYGKPPAAEWMQAGRQASEGINRMPGVFSDYGALSSMPGNLAHQMFYPKGTDLFKPTSDEKSATDPADGENYSNLAAMFGQLSEPEKQSLLAMLMSQNTDQGSDF